MSAVPADWRARYQLAAHAGTAGVESGTKALRMRVLVLIRPTRFLGHRTSFFIQRPLQRSPQLRLDVGTVASFVVNRLFFVARGRR